MVLRGQGRDTAALGSMHKHQATSTTQSGGKRPEPLKDHAQGGGKLSKTKNTFQEPCANGRHPPASQGSRSSTADSHLALYIVIKAAVGFRCMILRAAC